MPSAQPIQSAVSIIQAAVTVFDGATIGLQIGPWGISGALSDFQAIALGQQPNPDALFRTIALAAGAAGVDVTNQAALAQFLSTTTFYY